MFKMNRIARRIYDIIERTEDEDGVFYDIWAYGYETREEAQAELDAIKKEWGAE